MSNHRGRLQCSEGVNVLVYVAMDTNFSDHSVLLPVSRYNMTCDSEGCSKQL